MAKKSERHADYQSATQQAASLRYEFETPFPKMRCAR
jgi:hypothetical protein